VYIKLWCRTFAATLNLKWPDQLIFILQPLAYISDQISSQSNKNNLQKIKGINQGSKPKRKKLGHAQLPKITTFLIENKCQVTCWHTLKYINSQILDNSPPLIHRRWSSYTHGWPLPGAINNIYKYYIIGCISVQEEATNADDFPCLLESVLPEWALLHFWPISFVSSTIS